MELPAPTRGAWCVKGLSIVKQHLIEPQPRWMVNCINENRAVQRSMIYVYFKMCNMKDARIKPCQEC